MGFPKEIMQSALEIKAGQRESAIRRAEAAKEKLYKDNSTLAELDRALAATGAMIATVALSGDKKLMKELAERSAQLSEKRKSILASTPTEPEFSCKKCKDTGRVDGITCSCVKDIARELLYAKLCAQMPLEESTFDSFRLTYYSSAKGEGENSPRARMKEILSLCKKYAADFSTSSESLLFLGGVGLGKTHLSLAIANAAIKKGYGVVYGPAPGLIAAVERERFSGEENGALDSLMNCDLLIIDDLGTEFSTQFSVSVVNDVINTRLQKKLPTILNTNLSLRELADKYTPRVSSRLIGCYTMRQFLGNDIRQLKKLEETAQ